MVGLTIQKVLSCAHIVFFFSTVFLCVWIISMWTVVICNSLYRMLLYFHGAFIRLYWNLLHQRNWSLLFMLASCKLLDQGQKQRDSLLNYHRNVFYPKFLLKSLLPSEASWAGPPQFTWLWRLLSSKLLLWWPIKLCWQYSTDFLVQILPHSKKNGHNNTQLIVPISVLVYSSIAVIRHHDQENLWKNCLT